MPPSESECVSPEPISRRRADLPAWALLAWVAVMGTLYARTMLAERGRALAAPVAAVAARLGLTTAR
jgi:hypothetical protein